MTVSAPSSLTYTAAGNGSTKTFPYTLAPFYASSELEVIIRTSSADTVKVLGTHYTVSGGNGSTGSVTFGSAPEVGETVVITRRTARTQTVDMEDTQRNPVAALETQLDRTVMMIQELPALPAPNADNVLGWNAAGTALENKATVGQSVEAAEAAADRAEDAADDATAAAASLVVTRFATAEDLEAYTVSVTAKSVWLSGYDTVGDAGGGTWVRTNAVPDHNDWIRSTDRFRLDGTTNNASGGFWVKSIAEVGQSDNWALLEDAKLAMRAGSPVSIVCFGDSLTAGTGSTTIAYPGSLQAFLRDYYQNDDITLTNAGVGGETTVDLIGRYVDDVQALAPDIMLLWVGMNDGADGSGINVREYSENVSRIISMAKRDGIAVVMSDISPRKRLNNDGWQFVDPYRRAARNVAASHGVAFVPMYDILTDLVSCKNGYSWTDISTDGIHFNDAGYRLIAGAWLAYALATEPLAMKVGQHKDMIGPHVVLIGNAVATYTSVEDSATNSKEAATLRYTATDSSSNLRIWLWVEGYEHCDMVLYLTRENHATLTPTILLNNLETDGTARTYVLGQQNATTGRAVSVPLRVCELRPGLNIINTRVSSTQTAEFAKFSIEPVAQDHINQRGLRGERYAGSVTRYSSEGTTIDYAANLFKVGNGAVTVPAGARAYLGELDGWPDNASTWMARYRLRGKLVSGLVLEVGDRSYPANEHTPAAEFEFTLTSGTVWTVARKLKAGASTITIGSTAVTVTSTAADTLLTFYLNRDSLVLYLDAVSGSPITLPFAMGPAALIARNGGASAASFNPLYRLGNGVFSGNIEGEQWIDFTGSALKTVIGTTIKSVTVS